jgi:hypothetical protein
MGLRGRKCKSKGELDIEVRDAARRQEKATTKGVVTKGNADRTLKTRRYSTTTNIEPPRSYFSRIFQFARSSLIQLSPNVVHVI